jgi:hypothetical protein
MRVPLAPSQQVSVFVLCTSKAYQYKSTNAEPRLKECIECASPSPHLSRCQYLYFCTSKLQKVQTLSRALKSVSNARPPRPIPAGVSICTFVLVKLTSTKVQTLSRALKSVSNARPPRPIPAGVSICTFVLVKQASTKVRRQTPRTNTDTRRPIPAAPAAVSPLLRRHRPLTLN